MNQQVIQKIALDSCVVIDLIEKPTFARRVQKALKGKSVQIVLCDVVLNEVQKVRGYSHQKIVSKISEGLKRSISIVSVNDEEKIQAKQISDQFQICHNGDNKILAICQMKNYILVTFDRMLRKASEFVGIAVFHPLCVGGI
jgi:predicted nucleic acid-binding protein